MGVQLKSSILDINVPSPRHFSEDAISYPCVVKVNMSSNGIGNRLLKNESELSATLRQIRRKRFCFKSSSLVSKKFPAFNFICTNRGNSGSEQQREGLMEYLTGLLEQWTGTNKRNMRKWCAKSSLCRLKNTYRREATLAWSLLRFLSQIMEGTWLT